MKNKRFPLIRQLISSQTISTQTELVLALNQMGIKATQATISRDIKLLGLVKRVDEKGIQRYFLADEPTQQVDAHRKLIALLRDAMVGIDDALNILVMRTIPGHAHAVASQLDILDWSELVGTVAGDDTVLMITKSECQMRSLKKRIYQLLE